MGKFAQAAEVRERVDTTCIVGKKIVGFDDDDIAWFEQLLSKCKHLAVVELFGGSPGVESVRKHSKGRCTCPDNVPGKGAGATDG